MQNRKKTHAEEQNIDESPYSFKIILAPKYTFNDALLEAIDEAFSTLGESAKNSIYTHLENNASITKTDIPHRIDDFQKALEELFGMGARFLEILFMKSLYKKIRTNGKGKKTAFALPQLSFQEYVHFSRKEFASLKPKEGNELQRKAL